MVEKILPKAELEPGTARSVGQRLTDWATALQELSSAGTGKFWLFNTCELDHDICRQCEASLETLFTYSWKVPSDLYLYLKPSWEN